MYLIIKRVIDIILALVFLIILIPLFIVIIIALKISGIDNLIFSQDRSGKNNIAFRIYKFKTIGNKNNKFSNFLRKSGLDELPQLVNILKGDMSLVGPRPWILDYSKYFNEKEMKRLSVLPGLTGYAQISDCNNIFDKINKDLYYIEHISLAFDTKIFFKTIIYIFSKQKKDINNITEELNCLKRKRDSYEKS